MGLSSSGTIYGVGRALDLGPTADRLDSLFSIGKHGGIDVLNQRE